MLKGFPHHAGTFEIHLKNIAIAHAWAYAYPISDDVYVFASTDRNNGGNLLRLQRGRDT